MTLPPWLTGALRTELSGLAPRRAAVSAVGLVTPLAVGAATGELRVATVVALGALLTGVIAISTPVGVPFLRMAASGVAVALSTVVGCATGGHPALAVPLVAVWGAAAGLLTTAGPGATTVGVQAITGLVVTGRFPLPVPAALEQGGLVLVGAGLQLLLAAVVRSPTADAAVRGPLSALATSLAAWCRLPADPLRLSGTADALASAATAVSGAEARGAPRAAALRSVLDDLARARLELVALTTLSTRQGPGHAELLAALTRAATAFDRGADALGRGLPEQAGQPLLQPAEPLPDPVADRHLRALAGQLRAVRSSTHDWYGAGRPLARPHAPSRLPQLSSARTTLAALRPGSPTWRHVLRMSAALVVAELVVRGLGLPRGYWAALTVAQVLRPDFASTASRGAGRLAGTLLGIVPATLLVGLVHPRGALLVGLAALAAWAAYSAFPAGYGLFTAALTTLVVILLDIVDPQPVSVLGDRVADTALGGGVALLAYLALPSWEGQRLETAVARLAEAVAVQACVVLGAAVRGGGVPADAAEETGRAVRQARSAAEASLARAQAEPSYAHGQVQRVAGALAALQRIGRSLQLVRLDLGPTSRPVPELAPLAAALPAALSGAAGTWAGGPGHAAGASLRAAAEPALALAEGAGRPGVDVAALSQEVDELVDAAGTLQHVSDASPVPG